VEVVIYDTEPQWKMPDEEILSHEHHVCLRLDFHHVKGSWGPTYLGDLTEYYQWVKYQSIPMMEHNIMRMGREDTNKNVNVVVMFTFPTIGDAVAFKLMWK